MSHLVDVLGKPALGLDDRNGKSAHRITLVDPSSPRLCVSFLLHTLFALHSESVICVLISQARTSSHFNFVARRMGAKTDRAKFVAYAPGQALSSLYERVAAVAAGADPARPLCLVLDDLSDLLVFEPLHLAVAFLNYCSGLLSARAAGGTIITAVAEGEGDEEMDLLVAEAVHCADTVMAVRPLSSGRAQNVDGNLFIEGNSLASGPLHLQFSVKGKRPHFFRPGFSADAN